MASPCKNCDDVLKIENQNDSISINLSGQFAISQTDRLRLKKSVTISGFCDNEPYNIKV